MSDRPFPSGRIARAAALVCSVALASIVIVHAQFGCDAPASTKTAPNDASVPTSDAPSPAPSPAKQDPQPPEAKPEAQPEPEPAPPPEPQPEPKPEKDERVFMPASKSAGDFDSLPLAPQANAPAKEPPVQQAQQAPQP